ncbi:MAG: AIDA repeat-containing protein, partial [Lentisphaeria bacterium]|nr:AIDA repeat-containing protein [Lentisphaeria bacterium]
MLLIDAGGSANWIRLHEGADADVYGIASSNFIYTDARMIISSGGSANDNTTYSGGTFTVGFYGTANSNTIYSGGFMTVHESGTATSTTLIGSGSGLTGVALMEVRGGSAYNTTIGENAFMSVSKGIFNSAWGSACYIIVNSDGRLDVNSNALALRTEVNEGGVVNLVSGGRANSTTVNDGGNCNVYSDCLVYDTTVNDGGTMTIYAGGKAYSGTVVNSGGREIVSFGGVANSTTLNSNGYELVFSGGTANNTTVNSGGNLVVHSGGTANNAEFNHGYGIIVRTINNASIANWGWIILQSNGRANNTTVNSNGWVNISEGGIADSTTINDGGNMTVNYGGGAKNTTVRSGGWLGLSNGALLNSAIVNSGGTAEVNGTVYANDFVVNGGIRIMSGGTMANGQNLTLGSSATLTISSGGRVDGAIVRTSAHATVEGGGTFATAGISAGRVTAKSGAILDGVFLDSGSILEVASGAVVQDVCVSSGAVLTGVLRNATDLTFSGGTLDLNIAMASENDGFLIDGASYAEIKTGAYDCTLSIANKQLNGAYKLITGASDFNKTITVKFLNNTLGTLTVNGGPTNVGNITCDLTLTSGDLVVTVTGGAIPDPIYSSTTLINERKDITSGMSAVAINVSSGGILNVFSSGVASNTMVYDGGEFNVHSDGRLKEASIYSGGTATIYEDTRAQDVRVMSGGMLVVESDALIYQASGGKTVSNNVAVYQGGRLNINGGWVDGALVSGGKVTITSNGSMTEASIESGTVWTQDGGFAGMTILESGVVNLASGGTGSCTVSSGGKIRLEDGCELNGLTVRSGGILTGVMHGIYSVVKMYDGTLNFDISLVAPSNEFLFDMDANIDTSHGCVCTLTVDTAPVKGTYNLMEYAYDYNTQVITAETPLTVKSYSGATLGTLTIGETVTIGDTDYTLNLSDDYKLTVTISGSIGPEPVTAPTYFIGDFNGEFYPSTVAKQTNGTVKVYGPPNWSIALDPGWTVVESGDFDGDGYGDFLRINDEGYVVGELNTGNNSTVAQVLNLKNAGWDILGTGDFNGNGTDDVLIANPTGASETVGLLGYWESGVTWTLINGYSAEWEMISCGDFNGDGKCDMLWRNSFEGEGGLTYNAYCTWIVEDPVDWRMVSVANPAEWNFLCSGDFDGNGMNDIAMINDVGVVGIWGVNDGYLNSWSILSAVDTSAWTLAGVGDFNADGTDDIAWASDSL